MPSWAEIEAAAPELAASVRERFDAHKHKTIATLRRDGSPRISGTEARIEDGELWIGSMLDALKAQDLQRDPRFALHCGTGDSEGWSGDAKIAGRAEEINGSETPGGRSHLFRLDVSEHVVVRLGEPADHLVIESWREGREVRRVQRR